MKPDAFHVVRREGARFVFTNQAGQCVEVPAETTLAALMARGIVVRLHRVTGTVRAEDFAR